MPVILMYRFAAQQESGTCRSKKSGSIYSIFSVEGSELFPSFPNAKEVGSGLKISKIKQCLKNV